MVIEEGGRLIAEAHGEKVDEFITVYEGVLTVIIDKETFEITKGNSIRFRADKEHSYHNLGNKRVEFSMVVNYPENK